MSVGAVPTGAPLAESPGVGGALTLMSCVREASTEPSYASEPPDKEAPAIRERNETKKGRFFRGLRRMFRRRGGAGSGSAPCESRAPENSADRQTDHIKSRSTGELMAEQQRRKVVQTAYTSGLSVSHDSVFTGEHSASAGSGSGESADESNGTQPSAPNHQRPTGGRGNQYMSSGVRTARADDIPSSLVPTSQQRHVHVVQRALGRSGIGAGATEAQRAFNVYVVALVAGVAAAIAVGIVGFALGWYTLKKRAKAAADVEYPAYGVTGPNIDVSPSSDRKLAHSAQLYHYQHQKQQIIASERSNGNHNGSISDPESEDDNEEGDYTVYECPGFATTGEMEVKNPLFSDDPTPASQKSSSSNSQTIQVTIPASTVCAPPPTVIITNKK